MRARMEVLVATVIPLVVIFLSMSLVHAQLPELENFSVAPADFALTNIPPLGEPYVIEQKLAIHNGADVERNFVLSALVPPPENLEPGYEPFPNENWVLLIPALIQIDANSDNLVEMGFDLPRWENLTGQKWEVWISVTRLAKPGELVEIELISKAYIETTEELPPPPSDDNDGLLLPFAVIIILAVGVVGIAFLFARHRRGKKEAGILPSSI